MMEETQDNLEKNIEPIETLESNVKAFADELSYWEKFLAEKILSGTVISDKDIDAAYSYLLEGLNLKPETVKPEIIINYKTKNATRYKFDLQLSKLENVEGVNALSENQIIEFSPNMSIIYGATGSGKSGNVRLMKKVFYSKTAEEIVPNIYLTIGHKPISANFTFHSTDEDILLKIPDESTNSEFEQFAVFDNKSVIKHLEQKNPFEFRPAGLSFFTEFIDALEQVQKKLNDEILNRKSENNFSDLFDGDSEIKTLIENLSAQTNISELEKYVPFPEKDEEEKRRIEKDYDELLLASKGKEKEIKAFENIIQLISTNKQSITSLNKFFATDYLTQIQNAISDCIGKEAIAKKEGIESFNTDKIKNIGSVEWKNFIKAAEHFANKQNEGNDFYPENGDNCLLCLQPLLPDAQQLIKSYWIYNKSLAEENSKKAQETLDKFKKEFEEIKFELFDDENILTAWLSEKYPKILSDLKQSLIKQKTLASSVISDIVKKSPNKRAEIKTNLKDHETLISSIDSLIRLLKTNQQSVELERLLKNKTTLIHKEKLNIHFTKFQTYINNQKWISKTEEINWMTVKKKTTDREKYLWEKYFNQKYIDTFNKECEGLKGNFGISISHTGTAGTSFRQMFIANRNPSTILSEGEQKVIALADFLSEMQLSEVNRGIIFDDPVNSLDDNRKKDIALRLVNESINKQVVIFTHDLLFVSHLITICEESHISFMCHWIENRDGKPGQIWLNNAPSHEKVYRNAEPARKFYSTAKKEDCSPEQREFLVKSGFTALRTCYEVLVINDLFKNVVQRYNERVSMEALSNVYFSQDLIDELLDSFSQCCRYMEGHSHSDKYVYKKPEYDNLNQEIQRYEEIRTKLRKTKKNHK